jgi:hypothetical protein
MHRLHGHEMTVYRIIKNVKGPYIGLSESFRVEMRQHDYLFASSLV